MVIVITNLLPFQGDVSPAANINRKSVEPNWVMECNNVAIRCFFSESKDGFLTQFTTKKLHNINIYQELEQNIARTNTKISCKSSL